MPRKYEVKAPREFLYWSIGLGLLTVWAVRDGWAGHWADAGLEVLVSNVIRDYPDYPADGFYLFNRVLTFLAGIGSVVCAVMHRIAVK